MNENLFPKSSNKSLFTGIGAALCLLIVAGWIAYKYVDPAPPKHFVISTGDGEGDYQAFANLYKDFIKENGIDLEIRPSHWPMKLNIFINQELHFGRGICRFGWPHL